MGHSSGVVVSGGGTPGAAYMYQLLDTEDLNPLVEDYVLKVSPSLKVTQEAPATAASLGASLLGVMVWHSGSSSYLWIGGNQPDSGAYTNILFIGPNDPAAATGWPGEANNHLWADTAP